MSQFAKVDDRKLNKKEPLPIPEGETAESWKWKTWSSRCEICNQAISLASQEINKYTQQFDPTCGECRKSIRKAVRFHEEDHWRVYEEVWGNPEEKMGGAEAYYGGDAEADYQGSKED